MIFTIIYWPTLCKHIITGHAQNYIPKNVSCLKIMAHKSIFPPHLKKQEINICLLFFFIG